MYRTLVRQAFRVELLVALVVLAVSACGGGSSAKDGAEKAATMETVSGDGGEQLGDSGPAKSAGLCGPTDVALDAEGNMYISDTGDYCSGPGTKARLDFPSAVAVDREGNLYIADGSNYRIRKVDKDGIITTFAGTGEARHSGDGGPATSAQLREPACMVFDAQGN